MENKEIRLALGVGEFPSAGYTNVDIRGLPGVDVVADVTNLPFGDNSVVEVKSRNLIEHFGRHEIKNLLKEWARVLKPGGVMNIETVDMGRTMTNWKYIPEENLLDAVLGAQTYPENFHKMMFTESSLIRFLEEAGLVPTRTELFTVREIPRIIISATKP